MERRDTAVDVGALGALDPDYLRAQMRQLHRAVRAGPYPAKIQHPDSGQRSARRRCGIALRLLRRGFRAAQQIVVLAQARRRTREPPSHRGGFERCARHQDRPAADRLRARQRNEEFPAAQMLVGIDVGHDVDRRERDSFFLRGRAQIVLVPSAGPFFQKQAHRVVIAPARQPVLEDLFVGPIGIAHQFDQPIPHRLFGAVGGNQAVAAFIDAERGQRARSQARGLPALIGIEDEAQLQRRGENFLLRDFNRLAAPALHPARQRGHDYRGGVESALELRLLSGRLERGHFGQRRTERRQRAKAPRVDRGQVIGAIRGIRTEVAERGDARRNQPRIGPAQFVIVESVSSALRTAARCAPARRLRPASCSTVRGPRPWSIPAPRRTCPR